MALGILVGDFRCNRAFLTIFCLVGAPLAGRISDKLVIRWRERRGGVWYPEDRLRVTLFAAATLVPLSSLFFGLLHEYVGGTVGLILNLICLFMNGVGVSSTV